MKSRINSYIIAEQLIRENAAIDIANLITNNERLLAACKKALDRLKYLERGQYDYMGTEYLCSAIQIAEGK